MAKSNLFEKVKTDLKESLTKVSKKTIEKKSQKNPKSKASTKDTEKFDSSDDETLVTNVTTNLNIQTVPRGNDDLGNDDFLGEPEDFDPEFITNSDVRAASTINNAGLLGLDNNGAISIIGESENSVHDLVHSFQQTTIS